MLVLVSLPHLQEPFKESDTSSWWCCFQAKAWKRDGMKCGIWWIGPSKTVAIFDFSDITQLILTKAIIYKKIFGLLRIYEQESRSL